MYIMKSRCVVYKGVLKTCIISTTNEVVLFLENRHHKKPRLRWWQQTSSTKTSKLMKWTERHQNKKGHKFK